MALTIATLLGIVVAVLTIIERLRGLRKKPQPLDTRLADIAQAIRDLRDR